MPRCCYICWGHNSFLFWSGTVCLLTKWMMLWWSGCEALFICFSGSPKAKQLFSAHCHLCIILLHSEKRAIAEQNTSGCLIEWLICCLSLLTLGQGNGVAVLFAKINDSEGWANISTAKLIFFLFHNRPKVGTVTLLERFLAPPIVSLAGHTV